MVILNLAFDRSSFQAMICVAGVVAVLVLVSQLEMEKDDAAQIWLGKPRVELGHDIHQYVQAERRVQVVVALVFPRRSELVAAAPTAEQGCVKPMPAPSLEVIDEGSAGIFQIRRHLARRFRPVAARSEDDLRTPEGPHTCLKTSSRIYLLGRLDDLPVPRHELELETLKRSLRRHHCAVATTGAARERAQELFQQLAKRTRQLNGRTSLGPDSPPARLEVRLRYLGCVNLHVSAGTVAYGVMTGAHP